MQFVFEVGMAHDSPLALWAGVEAANKEEAVARLRKLLEDRTKDAVFNLQIPLTGGRSEIVRVYVFPRNITEKDITTTGGVNNAETRLATIKAHADNIDWEKVNHLRVIFPPSSQADKILQQLVDLGKVLKG